MGWLRDWVHGYDQSGWRGLLRAMFLRRASIRGDEPQAVEPPDACFGVRHPFDVAHGTDTSGYIAGGTLRERRGVGSFAEFYNTAYYAISPSSLSQAVEHIPGWPGGLQDFTFVDLGCGKGRALLVAAQYRFNAVLGVELSGTLCRIAAANTRLEPRISVREGDAAEVSYPASPLVVFLYHPFLAPVLRRVLRNLEEQLRRSPRPVFLLYANPTYPGVMARFPFLREVWHFGFDLSEEDAAADRHGVRTERYQLFEAT